MLRMIGPAVRAVLRWARRYEVWRPVGAIVLTGLAVALVVAIYGPLADWAGGSTVRGIADAEKRAAAINAVRQTLLATAAGAAALVGLAFTTRTFYLSRRGQLTDRYNRAISQLASEKLEERLGGIYALEHLMRESPRDHMTVVEVLAAFVRENAHREDDSPPATDVQGALTVLGRRPDRSEPHRLNLENVDLRAADLSGLRLDGANLAHARLHGANLYGTRLRRARLTGAQLHDAVLVNANLNDTGLIDAALDRADLSGADLRGARLGSATLEGATLRDALLDGADLTDVVLSGVDLTRARLERAVGLTTDQLQTAAGDHPPAP